MHASIHAGATPHALVNHLVEVYGDSEVRRRTLAGIELELQEHQAGAAAATPPPQQQQQEAVDGNDDDEAALLPLPLTSPRSGGRRRGRWWRLRHRYDGEPSPSPSYSTMAIAEEGKEAAAAGDDGGSKPLAAAAEGGGGSSMAASRGVRVGWSTQFWVLCKRSLLHT